MDSAGVVGELASLVWTRSRFRAVEPVEVVAETEAEVGWVQFAALSSLPLVEIGSRDVGVHNPSSLAR